jgi:hypothetical protein
MAEKQLESLGILTDSDKVTSVHVLEDRHQRNQD